MLIVTWQPSLLSFTAGPSAEEFLSIELMQHHDVREHGDRKKTQLEPARLTDEERGIQ